MGQIIQIRKNDKNIAEGIFCKLMETTEIVLNSRAANNNWQTTNSPLTSSTLENEAVNAIKEACNKVKEFDATEHPFLDLKKKL